MAYELAGHGIGSGGRVGVRVSSGTLDLYLPSASWWWIAPVWLLLVTPPGRITLSAAGARLVLPGCARDGILAAATCT